MRQKTNTYPLGVKAPGSLPGAFLVSAYAVIGDSNFYNGATNGNT